MPSQLFTSSGSAQKYRLLFRFRGTVRDQGMLFFILLQVIGPHLEPIPGFSDPVCSGWLRIYFLLYKNGSSNRLSVSIRCYYPIILSSLIHGKPDFVSFPVSIFTGTGQILGYMWLRIRVFIQLIMLLFTRYMLMEAFCKLKLELPSYIRFGL